MNHTMKKYTHAFLKSVGTILFFTLCTGTFIALAAWQEPGVGEPNLPGVSTIEDYQPLHVLMDPQHKNYAVLPDVMLSVGSPGSIYSGGAIVIGGAAAFSPFLALISGNFFEVTNNPAGYSFPEATYIVGMKKLTGNITSKSRPDTTGNGVPVIVPGFVRADVSDFVGNTCSGVNNPCNVVFLEGGTQTGLPLNDPANDMVNILLRSNVSEEPAGAAITTNRFGLEKTGLTSFVSLRMGQVYVDKVFVGGLVDTPLTTAVQAGTANNYIGNFVSGPDATNIAKPYDLQGGLSSGAGTTATTKFSNLGYGDYCYLQNPTIGGICPDGFFLSKYDGQKEAICRSFNPSPSPTAIDVKPDFKQNPNYAPYINNHANNVTAECKSTPPTFVCSDGLDNDGDSAIDSFDPGCHTDGNAGNASTYDPVDMNEFNVPPPPAIGNNKYVTAHLKGPYLGKGCNFNAPLPGGLIDQDKSDWITFIDTPPFGVTPNSYPPTQAQLNWANDPGYLFNEIPYIEYVSSNDKIPQKGDTIVANGHYGYNTIFGNYVRKGAVVPGWYFIKNQLNPPYHYPLYKVKIDWGNTIVDVKSC
jgi:hypothetical protein